MLKNELGNDVKYYEMPDYPAPYSSGKFTFYLKFGAAVPAIMKGIKREHRELERIVSSEKYHRIVSDNRYGIYHRDIPSYLITHQLRFMAPHRISFIEKKGERFVASFQDKFTSFIVPDDENGSLSGELSHRLDYIDTKKVFYSGPLSDFSKKDTKHDIDLFISISGPEPQRSIFERNIMESAPYFPPRTVITLGKSEEYGKKRRGNAVVYTYLTKERREDLMNRSKLILSRSGYSTLMDLAVLGKKAVFIPTPAQTEQEYLSKYHMEKGTYFSMNQKEFCMKEALLRSQKYKGISMDGLRSVERILSLLG